MTRRGVEGRRRNGGGPYHVTDPPLHPHNTLAPFSLVNALRLSPKPPPVPTTTTSESFVYTGPPHPAKNFSTPP